MPEKRNCFTFIWKIKNFNFAFKKRGIFSPYFNVSVLSGTKWKLLLFTDSSYYKGFVACYFERGRTDSGPDQLELDYELSFVSSDGSVLHSEKFLNKLMEKSTFHHSYALNVRRDELFFHQRDLFIPDNTLTICCKMWDSQKSMPQSGKCLAETLIETEFRYFVGTIEHFSFVQTRDKYPICIKSSSTEKCLVSMGLHVADDEKLSIEMELAVSEWKCVIFILDVFGNKTKSGKGEFHDTKSQCISLTLPKEHLIENKDLYFPNNILTIECEITFPTDKKTERIDDPEYGFDYQDIRKMLYDTMKPKLPSNEPISKSSTTLKDDLNALFYEGVLCDVTLKTATETFSVHKAVLCARSSVFKSMFTADMREKSSNCVDIEDLDADTVRRMLTFMYLDTLEDLGYESARNLYFAADKYNIVSLKSECLNFLTQNILPTNCCDLLLLADKHEDKYLKCVIQDFIARNDTAVFFSDEWKNLEESHPPLAIEVLRAVYMKNRRC